MHKFLVVIEFKSETDFDVLSIEDLKNNDVIFSDKRAFELEENLDFPDSLYTFISELTGFDEDEISYHINEK